jgi:polyhydroxybutyrate depolymerase
MRFRTGALGALLVSALAIATHAEAQRRPIRDRARDGMGRRGDAQTAQNRQSVQVGGRNRTYLLRVPQTVARGTPLPLVIVLHGGGGNADNAELMTGFSALVDREELIVAYPDGSGRQGRNMLLTWNAGHCCAYAMQNNVDDVAFIDALITQVARTYSVDPQRVYVTGMSNGAMMSHRLGRELSHRIAAIAPVVGAVFGDEAVASSPVSAIMINGLKDESVPANGGPPGGLAKSQWDGTHPLPNVDQGNFWARSNGCNTTPSSSEQRQVIAWRWSCPAGLAVEVHQLRNGGHAWPGGKAGSKRGDRPSNVMDATETIWAFFKAHPKQTR